VYPELDKAGLVTSYLERKILYRNQRDGTFEDVSLRGGPAVAAKSLARGAAFGDLFNTGQMNVVINNMNGTPNLLVNLAPAPNHVLSIQLTAKPPNSFAFGARVSVYVKGHRMIDEVRSGGSFCSQNDLRLLFGLGSATQVDKIEVRWPDGSEETFKDIRGDQRIVVRQGKGLSSQKLLLLPRIYKP
jgi:hypothetical protein